MKIPRFAACVAIGALSCAFVAGCSTSSPQSAPRRTTAPTVSPVGPAACDVVTEDDATAALGTDPGPGVADTHDAMTTCAFGPYPNELLVSVDGRDGKALYESTYVHPVAGTAVDVPGVGSGAFSVTDPPLYEISFYKGDTYGQVALGGSAGTPLAAPALALATALANRL